MRHPLLLLCFLFIATGASAQDSAYARQIIRQLSSPEFHGRGVEYGGDSLAAEYLRGEMQRIGLSPLGDNYYQSYTFPSYRLDGDLSLTINGKRLTPYSDYRVTYLRRIKNIEEERTYRTKTNFKLLVGVEQLYTYSPLADTLQVGVPNEICIEVLNSKLPKRIRKAEAEIPNRLDLHHKTQNVCGILPGESDSMIVFCGHYDHCGAMGSNTYFPGAHDNASGCAAVLDIARHFCSKETKPRYTMVFMLFSGEESGLKGSSYAAQNPLVDFAKIKYLCNIDMFCGGDKGLIFFNAKSENTEPIYVRMSQINEQEQRIANITPRENRPNSDHYAFSKYCPAIFLLTDGGPSGGYHSPDDTCEKCGLSHYQDLVSLILKTLCDE